MNTLSQVSDLQIYFNRKYDSKNKTIDAASHNYIVSKAVQLIQELPNAQGGRFCKMLAKRQLQTLVVKSVGATKINE